MIHSRITSKSQTTIPRAVRDALKLRVGDRVIYRVEGETVTIARAVDEDIEPWIDPFATFTEWAGEADRAYDVLAERFPRRNPAA